MKRLFIVVALLLIATTAAAVPKVLCVVEYAPSEEGDWCSLSSMDNCGAYLVTGEAATRGNIHWCDPNDSLTDLVQQFSRSGKDGEVAFTEDPLFYDLLEVCDFADDTCVKVDCSLGTECRLFMEGLSTEPLVIENDAGQIRLEPCTGGGACGGTTSDIVAYTAKLWVGKGSAADIAIAFDLDTDQYAAAKLTALHLAPKVARAAIRKGALEAVRKLRRDPSSFGYPQLSPPYVRTTRCRRSGETPPYATRDEHPSSIIALMNMPCTKIE